MMSRHQPVRWIRSSWNSALSHAIVAASMSGFCGCGEETPALLAEIRSPLAIPTQTNELVVRIKTGDQILKQVSSSLGLPPRDAWPQTLPIVAGAKHRSRISVEIELRMNLPGVSTDAVGYSRSAFEFPETGTLEALFEVARICADVDGDGYGVGRGCLGPDCDETSTDVPRLLPCQTVACTPGGDDCDSEQICHQDACVPRCDTESALCSGMHVKCDAPSGACVCRSPCVEQADCQFCWPSETDCQITIDWECAGECCRPGDE